MKKRHGSASRAMHRASRILTRWRHHARASLVVLAVALPRAALPGAGSLPDFLPAAAPGMIESGVPAFSVYAIDSIGLTSSPTDLRELPDGRMVIAAGNRIAFGDGSAWQVFSPAPGQGGTSLQLDLVVGSDGGLYNGTIGGVRRIELQADGRWYVRTVATVPDSDDSRTLPFLRAFPAGDAWLWTNSKGVTYAWRPGGLLQPIAGISNVEYAVELDGRLILHQSEKGIAEYKDGLIRPASGFESLDRSGLTVRAMLRVGPNQLLIGTQVDGLHFYDGAVLRPFLLNGGAVALRQINDLCQLRDGLFAAAAGPDGVVFFDREGRVLQVLGRSLDHRLGAVRRLRYVNGAVWALLHEGIARIEFPSQFSDFTPISPSTLTYARPFRHEGRLWMLADTVVLRAEYTGDGRLETLVPDSPEGAQVWSIATIDGLLLAAADKRVYQRTAAGWVPVLEGAANARIEARAPDGRWLFTAKGEIGWVTVRDGQPHFERQAEPRLGDTYNLIQDDRNVAWLELGVGAAGRVDLNQPVPVLDFLGTREKIPDSWVQICLLDGEAVFSIANAAYSFDATNRQFVLHPVASPHFVGLDQALGRFARDAFGNLWLTAHERFMVHPGAGKAGDPTPPRIPEALQSATRGFIMESGGVVWILAQQRLLRYDPTLPQHDLKPVQPVITHVRFPATGAIQFSPQRDLHLDYAGNNLEFHFAAPRNPFQQQVSYEVRVDGLSDAWTPVESAPLAAYNHLHEGAYRFRVRAIVNGHPEGVASLGFSIAPPFHRSTAAYITYVAGAMALLAAVAALVTWINRRERRRLAALVASRTAELQTSQDQLRRAVESGSVGVWDYDLVGGRMQWNQQCHRIYGLSEDTSEITRDRYENMLHPDDREAVKRATRLAIERRSELRIEYRVIHPDGSVRWVAAIGRAVYAEDGTPVALRGAALDITERRQADEDLRNRERLQRQMIESSPVAMLMVDRQERILYGNATFTRLFGYTTADIPTVADWWPQAYPDPEYREAIRSEWLRRMERAGELRQPLEPMEAVVRCKDGTRRTIHFATSAVGDRTLVVFSDLTERKLAEQAVRDMNVTLERRVKERTAELEAANKELESFSYSVSHDLRAPLRGIDGWSLALLEDYGAKLDSCAVGYLDRVRSESQRLGQLIDDLLKLSRTSRAEFKPGPVNLSDLVEATAQRVAATRPGSRVQFSCQPGLTAHGDAGLLEAALFNLLDNAWKFTGKTPGPRVEFGRSETLSGPAFFIRDNGAGFDMRHSGKLFGVFQRMHAQEDFPGTGVGLATVQRIVRRHGGRIWAESVPGEQTTFYFQIPGMSAFGS